MAPTGLPWLQPSWVRRWPTSACEPAGGPLRRQVAEIEMERLAVLRAGLLLAWDYGPVRCTSAYVFHDHANR
jgi:hypothetical protein